MITNHTVTIAAELVSGFSTCLIRAESTPLQEDGQRIVGQCEISHPVSGQLISEGGAVFATEDVDGMGDTPAKAQNVMFEARSKNSHSSLPSRITREYPSGPDVNGVYSL